MESVILFNSLDFSILARLTFLLFLFVYVIFSSILVYHWKSYATDARVLSITLISYFSSTFILTALAGFTLLAI